MSRDAPNVCVIRESMSTDAQSVLIKVCVINDALSIDARSVSMKM